MDPERQKEEFSNAFIIAISSVAGFSATKPAVDDDSVDWLIARTGGKGTFRSPRLELQLKATTELVPLVREPEHFAYPLKRKNYDDLISDTYVPRILVIVHLPQHASDWLELTNEQLILRHSAYWFSLYGEAETQNLTSVSVRIPFENRLTVQTLTDIMGQIAEGERP